MTLTFAVRGKPQGKGRPRFTRSGRAYTPKKTADYEELIRSCYRLQCRDKKLPEGVPLRLRITAYFPIPKNTPKAERRAMAEGSIKPAKKPDGDNIEKAVADALNGTAYGDDRMIVSASWEKLYAADEEHAGLIVTIESIESEELS